MAQQSSFLKTIFNTPGYSIMGGTAGGRSEQVVVDPWNNKYYGDQKKDVFLNHFDSQIKSVEQTLKQGYTEVSRNMGMGGGFGNFNSYQRQPLDDKGIAALNSQLADLQKQRQDFDQNYVQKDRFFESYNAYQDKWNQYFEGSYRNPRIESEQKQESKQANDAARQQAQEASDKQQLIAANNQLNIEPPRTLNTGLSATKDSFSGSIQGAGGTGLGL